MNKVQERLRSLLSPVATRVELPLSRLPDQRLPNSLHLSAPASSDLSCGTLLNGTTDRGRQKNIRTSLSRFFDLHGNSAVSAETGGEALELLRRDSFDCVILDLKLPDMEGIQVMERMREADPFVPVILLTAHGTTGKAVEAIKKGAFDFFEKPADEEKLLIAVKNAAQLFRLNSGEVRIVS
jgi:CheY-like chemotaxis protein